MVTPDLNKLRDQVRTGRAGGPRAIAPPPADEPSPLAQPALPRSGWTVPRTRVERIDAWLMDFHTRRRENVAALASIVGFLGGIVHAAAASGFWMRIGVFFLIWFGCVVLAMTAFHFLILALRKAVHRSRPLLTVAAFLFGLGLLRAWSLSS